MEHVLEHLVTTAEADAVLEENVMAQRLLFQSAGTRPNGDFDVNETIYVIWYKHSVNLIWVALLR